jgi:tetratricopeptide (TPR) repeat protein
MQKTTQETMLESFSTLGNLVTVVLLITVCVALVFLLWRTLRRVTAEFRVYRSIWLLFKGQYDSAIQLIDELLRSGLLTKTSTRVCLYNKANCQHRQGRIKNSVATLAEIDQEGVNTALKAAISGLQGANLLLQELELPSARQCLESYHSRTKFSSGLLSLAHCEFLLGNRSRANDLVKSFLHEANRRKRLVFSLGTFLISDKAFERCHDNFFLGHHYLRNEERKQAIHHFTEATTAPTSNVYAERAKLLLATIA